MTNSTHFATELIFSLAGCLLTHTLQTCATLPHILLFITRILLSCSSVPGVTNVPDDGEHCFPRTSKKSKQTTHLGQTSEHIPKRNWIYASNKCCDYLWRMCVCSVSVHDRRQWVYYENSFDSVLICRLAWINVLQAIHLSKRVARSQPKKFTTETSHIPWRQRATQWTPFLIHIFIYFYLFF